MPTVHAKTERWLSRLCATLGSGWQWYLVLGCWLLGCWLLGCWPGSTACGQVAPPSAEVACELRIVWGGENPRPYTGTLSVDSGTITAVRNLSLHSDSIGAIASQDLQTLEIKPQSASTFGGVDVAVQGSSTTHLRVRLNDPGSQTPTEFQVQLNELLHGSWVQTLDSRGNRVAIERQMHDRLRVRMDQSSGILETNQRLSLELSGYRTGLPAGSATAELRFVSQAQAVGQVVQRALTIDTDGSFEKSKIELQAPIAEGAYHLEIAVSRRGYLNSLVSTAQPLVRRVDMVVFDTQARPQQIVAWKPLAAIDPVRASKPGSLAWLSSLDMLSPWGLQPKLGVAGKLQPYNPLSGSLNQPISHGTLGTRQFLLPNPVSGRSEPVACLTLQTKAWLAIPLMGLSGDRPYRLRMRVPTDRPMQLAVSLQQTNVVGDFPPLSLDSGIAVGTRQAQRAFASGPAAGGEQTPQSAAQPVADSPDSASDLGAVTEHEVVFWPRGAQAYVVLANAHDEFEASISDIQLERAELAPAPLPEHSNATWAGQRMVGINLDKPLLADCVSAKREIDGLTGRPLESWSTWQEAISRICQLMQARDTNTLLIKAFSEGGAVFPSDHLQPTYRYDNGTFFSDSRGPEIKDALELMLRHFDRLQLHLVIALDLNTSLPALRRFEEGEEADSLLQQPLGTVTPRGPAGATHSSPRYNPLNPRVQEEIVAAVRDIIKRYGHHPSLAGLAIQLDDQSQLVFAGDRWGYDPQTLAAFQKAAQLKLPPRDQLEAVFSGAPRLAFLDWRAAELTKFYARLGEVVSGGSEQRKLYLNAIRLWDNFPAERNFINPEAIIRNPREYLLAFGIAPERLAQSPQVELMRGSFDLVNESVHAQDWIRHESGQRGLVEFFAGADTSAMVLRYPRRQQLESSGKLGDSAPQWIYPTLSAPREHARKKLINQIFHSDPLLLVEGGWLPFSGQEEGVGALFRTLSELPPIKLTMVRPRESDSNLRVRQGSYRGKSYLQIINNASWTENVKIGYQLSTRNPTPPRVLGGRPLELNTGEREQQWSLTIPPYDVIALEIEDPRLTLTKLQHAPAASTLQSVRAELEHLDELVSQSADLAEQKRLANLQGEFEQWDEQQQPIGWSVSSLPQVTIAKSLDLPHTGRSSLQLENRGELKVSAWAQSRAVAPPRTGRLAVQAWLRAPAVSPPLQVKLAIVGRTHTGERFERAAFFGGRGAAGGPIAIDWGRKPATLYVGDVSSETVAELAVSIELIGPGKVWVDDVQIFESFLQPDERNHLRGQLLVAKQKLGENNPFPAEQLLDSHWGDYLLRYHQAAEGASRVAELPRRETDAAGNAAHRTSWSESPSVFRQFRENFRDRWRR